MTGTGGFAHPAIGLNRNGESEKQRISGSEYNDAFPTVVRTIAIEDSSNGTFISIQSAFSGKSERTIS